MTKNFLYTLLLSSLALFTMQCGSSANTADTEGTVLKGTIENAANASVFLDKLIIGQASNVITSTKADEKGNFTMNFPEGIKSGIYNLRINNARVTMAFVGTEKAVNITGELSQLARYNFEISGAEDTKVLRDLIQGLINRSLDAEGLEDFVDTTDNPELGAYIVYMAGANGLLDLQKKALSKLSAAQPSSEMAVAYAKYVQNLERKKKAASAGPIQVGQDAPDIKLASPEGKEYALSDLKGQIVLLDFWASWCRPCRTENPNVVKVYEKYKKQGFTVYSVSLDGNKDRWAGAIKQDKLTWPYHVSDLQKWQSAPAGLYGVRSIPRAFLIDREGKIAAVTVRGAEQLETELKKLLN